MTTDAPPEIITQVRMNDYVGPPIFAWVTWSAPCAKSGLAHSLGLLTHTCTRCGATPKTIAYQEGN